MQLNAMSNGARQQPGTCDVPLRKTEWPRPLHDEHSLKRTHRRKTMRVISRAALVLAASFIAAPAMSAQTSVIVAAGATVPMGDAADGMNMGYNVNAGIGFKPPVSPLGVRVEGMWSQLPFKGLLDGNNARVLGGTVNATLSGMAMPMGYFIGGLGLYNMGSDIDGASSTTKFGFNVGAGFN